MSKSRGNVVNPDDVIKEYGADTLRTFILFIGDYEKPAPWSVEGVRGCRRFLNRVWALADMIKETPTDDVNMAAVIKKTSDDYEAVKYNTAIACLMTAVNQFYNRGSVTKGELEILLKLLYPVAPHMTSEMFENLFGKKIEKESWPTYDEKDLVDDVVEMDESEAEIVEKAKEAFPPFKEMNIVKVIYVKGRILNIIAK